MCVSVCVVTFEDPLISDDDGVNVELLISVTSVTSVSDSTSDMDAHTADTHHRFSLRDTHTHTVYRSLLRAS